MTIDALLTCDDGSCDAAIIEVGKDTHLVRRVCETLGLRTVETSANVLLGATGYDVVFKRAVEADGVRFAALSQTAVSGPTHRPRPQSQRSRSGSPSGWKDPDDIKPALPDGWRSTTMSSSRRDPSCGG